jgi:hypothetical protein
MQDQYVCQQMMLSLGWEEPIFTATWHVDFYKCTCQVDLRPRFGRLVCHTKGITTKGEAKKRRQRLGRVLQKQQFYL